MTTLACILLAIASGLVVAFAGVVLYMEGRDQ